MNFQKCFLSRVHADSRETCAVRRSQDSTVRTAKLSSDEMTCGTERLEHTSYRATASGVGEMYFITHMQGVPTGPKLHPLQDVMELEKQQQGTAKIIKVVEQLVRRD